MENTLTIDHGTLRKLAEAGTAIRADVVGRAGGWGVLINYGQVRRALAVRRGGSPRVFRSFDTLASYLKAIGIKQYQVDASEFDPASAGAQEPDKRSRAASERLKQAHNAAAYKQWLMAQVKEAIDDPRPNAAHEDVMKRMELRIKKAAKAHKAKDVHA